MDEVCINCISVKDCQEPCLGWYVAEEGIDLQEESNR